MEPLTQAEWLQLEKLVRDGMVVERDIAGHHSAFVLADKCAANAAAVAKSSAPVTAEQIAADVRSRTRRRR